MHSYQDTWHWQVPGEAWKGVGIYHVTLTIPSREPLLGELIIPDNDPTKAYIQRTKLGNALVDELLQLHTYYSETRILQYCLMPDHLHAIIYVKRPLKKTFNTVIRGFWQGAKKLGRAYPSSISPELNSGLTNEGSLKFPPSIFTDRPFVRPMSRRGQLKTMIHYVQMNPQRLATKRIKPGFFRVQEGIEIAGRIYCGVGNVEILQAQDFAPVHVRRTMVEEAEHGDDKRLRDYMNGCVIKARKGTVMVSPYISQYEKEVLAVLLKEGRSVIVVADNGFGEYYKPSEGLFDSVAAGKVLILSPWEYDPKKKHVSREDCVEMNRMAEEICGQWSD